MGQINQEKENFWRLQMELAKKYEGSIGEFCREQGLSPHTFSYWRHKFNKRRGSAGALVSTAFVPVEMGRLRSCIGGFPDPKWLAEFISHLSGERQ